MADRGRQNNRPGVFLFGIDRRLVPRNIEV
jgi:hypothetical protein